MGMVRIRSRLCWRQGRNSQSLETDLLRRFQLATTYVHILRPLDNTRGPALWLYWYLLDFMGNLPLYGYANFTTAILNANTFRGRYHRRREGHYVHVTCIVRVSETIEIVSTSHAAVYFSIYQVEVGATIHPRIGGMPTKTQVRFWNLLQDLQLNELLQGLSSFRCSCIF